MNSLNLDNRGPTLTAITIAFLSFAVTTYGLRVYIRCRLVKSYGIDDFILCVALILYIVYCAFVIDGAHFGTGRHVWDPSLTLKGASAALETWYIAELLYIVATALTKASAGAMFLRVTTIRTHRIFIWVVMSLTLFVSVIFFFLVMFQCQPISFFWDPLRNPSHGRCISDRATTSATYLHSAVVATGDWSYGIFPFFLFRRLNLDLRTRISATLVLALANVGSIATLVRIKDIHEVYTNPDFLFVATDLAVWSTVEVGTSIAALSISTWRPLFQSFFKSRESRYDMATRSSSSASFRNLLSSLRKGSQPSRKWPTIQKIDHPAYEKALPDLPPSPATTCNPSTVGTFSSDGSWKRNAIHAPSPSYSTIKIYASPPQQPGEQV